MTRRIPKRVRWPAMRVTLPCGCEVEWKGGDWWTRKSGDGPCDPYRMEPGFASHVAAGMGIAYALGGWRAK